MLTVIAKITAQKGKEEIAKQALLGLIPPTIQEAGCIDYVLHQSNEDTSVFYFYENWESQTHLDQHLANTHIAEFGKTSSEFLAGPAELILATKL